MRIFLVLIICLFLVHGCEFEKNIPEKSTGEEHLWDLDDQPAFPPGIGGPMGSGIGI